MPENILNGRTALVTGATGRIGREIALSLAVEGVNVLIHYRHSRLEAETIYREIRKHGVGAWLLQADFNNSRNCELFIKRAEKIAGKPDILINSASSFTESTLQKVSKNDLIDNMQINAWAPLLIGRAFSRSAGDTGAIVNLLDSRIRGYDRSHVGYILSKHALEVLTAMMAMEFAPRITVNAVAPGLILPLTGAIRQVKNIPLKRNGDARDIARAVVFLLKSGFITGQVIWVDGGRHVRECCNNGLYR